MISTLSKILQRGRRGNNTICCLAAKRGKERKKERKKEKEKKVTIKRCPTHTFKRVLV